jgi:hypothetical protein
MLYDSSPDVLLGSFRLFYVWKNKKVGGSRNSFFSDVGEIKRRLHIGEKAVS